LFFFTLKKGAGTPYRRVPSQKSPGVLYHQIISLKWRVQQFRLTFDKCLWLCHY